MEISSGRIYVPGPSAPPAPGIPINPVTATFWPYSGNTGYLNAPGYPGVLTPYDVVNLGNSIPSGTYNYRLFSEQRQGHSVNFDQTGDYVFNGCVFESNQAAGSNITMANATSVTMNYSTIRPVPSIVAARHGAGPTNGGTTPPGGGGYSNWPSADIWYLGDGSYSDPSQIIDNDVGYKGICSIDQSCGPVIFNRLDCWGFSNGILSNVNTIGRSITRPWVAIECWLHDIRNEFGGEHSDGFGAFGDQNSAYYTFNNNTVCSIGNTNGFCNQGAFPAGPNFFDHMTLIGNYCSGFNQHTVFHALGGVTNLYYTDNVYATDNPGGGAGNPFDGSLTPTVVGNGTSNLFRRNKFLVRPRHTSPIVNANCNGNWSFWAAADSGKFLQPGSAGGLGAVFTSDWAQGRVDWSALDGSLHAPITNPSKPLYSTVTMPYANAPFANMLNVYGGFNARNYNAVTFQPQWNAAGIDYAVGIEATALPLKAAASLSIPGCSVNTSNHQVTVFGANVVIEGFDFTGWSIDFGPAAGNVTIRNNYFKAMNGFQTPTPGYAGVVCIGGAGFAFNSLIEKNVIDLNGNTLYTVAGAGSTWTQGGITVNGNQFVMRYNWIREAIAENVICVNIANNILINYNVFGGSGGVGASLTGLHGDTIQCFNQGTVTAGTVDVSWNTIYYDMPGPPGSADYAGQGFSMFSAGGHSGNITGQVSCTHNTLANPAGITSPTSNHAVNELVNYDTSWLQNPPDDSFNYFDPGLFPFNVWFQPNLDAPGHGPFGIRNGVFGNTYNMANGQLQTTPFWR